MRTYVIIASLILNILTLLVSVTGFLMVKFNDLKHLKKDVNKLESTLTIKIDRRQSDSDKKHEENKFNIKELSKIVMDLATIQSNRIGICETRHTVGKDN